MPRPSHSPWFDHPNNIWRSVWVMKLFIMQSSPASRPFPLRPKCSPQHAFGAKTSSTYALPLATETKFHTHTKYSSFGILCCISFLILIKKSGSIPWTDNQCATLKFWKPQEGSHVFISFTDRAPHDLCRINVIKKHSIPLTGLDPTSAIVSRPETGNW